MTCLADSGVLDLSRWAGNGDDLHVRFETGRETLDATIQLSNNGQYVAAIDEDTELYAVLADARAYDTDWLESAAGIFWTKATDTAPACIWVHANTWPAFLARLVALVTFVREMLIYAEGCRVHENLALTLRQRERTIIALTLASERRAS